MTPAKVITEITPKGWNIRILSDSGEEMSNRTMEIMTTGMARALETGNSAGDIEKFDPKCGWFGDAITCTTYYFDVAMMLRRMNNIPTASAS